MKELTELFLQQLLTTSYWEWLAVLLALAYLFLAIKESLWCWPAAFFSTIIFSILFFDVNLYMESLLNIYYLAMAIYGFYQWKNHNNKNNSKKPIVVWPYKVHILIILGGSFGVILSGYFLTKFTDQDLAYLDSFTTWFAVITTFMVTKKVLENWLYWIIINAASVYLFYSKGLALIAVLHFVYTIIAIFGYLKWRKSYLENQIG